MKETTKWTVKPLRFATIPYNSWHLGFLLPQTSTGILQKSRSKEKF